MNNLKLTGLLKEANVASGLVAANITPLKISAPPVVKKTESPKTPKGNSLKLTSQQGLKKPLFVHETKTNSPYRAN